MRIRRVLLVDDEPDIRTIGEMSLESVGGWEVRLASSGVEALAQVDAFAPDVILLDVMMPDLDGPGTLTALRERADVPHVPVIFMTARVQPKEVDAYLALGAAGVIHKPFDPMTLPDDVRRILGAL